MTMEDASPIKDGGFVVVILVFGGVYNPGFLAPTHTHTHLQRWALPRCFYGVITPI